jgi:hypothetical protein
VALKNAKSFNAILRVQSTLSVPKNPGLSTKKNVRSTFTVGSTNGCAATLTASLHTDIRLGSQIADQSNFNAVAWPSLILARSDMVCATSLTADLATDLTMGCLLAGEADMVAGDMATDITMQLAATCSADVEVTLETSITMTSGFGAAAQVTSDLLTNITLGSVLLDAQSSLGELHVPFRVIVIDSHGKLSQVPYGEEGLHTPVTLVNGRLTEGGAGPMLFYRLGKLYAVTDEETIV